MRKLRSPHLGAAKLCCQTPHLGAAVRQPRAGQQWLSPVLITPAPQVPGAPGAAAPRGPDFTIPWGQSERLFPFLILLQLISKLSSPLLACLGRGGTSLAPGGASRESCAAPTPGAALRASSHARLAAKPGRKQAPAVPLRSYRDRALPPKGLGRAVGGNCPIVPEPGAEQAALHGSEVQSATGSSLPTPEPAASPSRRAATC